MALRFASAVADAMASGSISDEVVAIVIDDVLSLHFCRSRYRLLYHLNKETKDRQLVPTEEKYLEF